MRLCPYLAPRRHRLDIYDVSLTLATTRRDWATIRRIIKPLTAKPTSLGLTQRLTWQPKGDGIPEEHYVFWIDTATIGDDHGQLIDTCAHEAVHAANLILDWVGHPIAALDEPHAYLTGWLTRWLWEGCAGG